MNTPDILRRVARKLFASKGFTGASVRDITAQAKANLGAVTYHFGSKEGLYHAVLADVFDDLATRVEAAAAAAGTTDQRLRGIVRALFAFFHDQPDAPHLVLRELARRGAPPAPVVPHVRRVLAAITGVVNRGPDSFLIAFSLISQCVWFAVIGPHMPAMLNLDLPHAALAARMQSHIADVVVKAATP